MKRTFVLIAFILTKLQLSVACSCITFGPLSIKDFNESQAFFIGRVTAIQTLVNPTDYNGVEVTLEVKEIFKGFTNLKELKIYTASNGAACGLPFAKNEEWLIDAYLANGKLATNMCTRSRMLAFAKKEELALLRSFSNQAGKQVWMVNGVKRGEGAMKNNSPVGYWRYFYPDGSIQQEVTYLDGKPNGRLVEYFDATVLEKAYRNMKVNEMDILLDHTYFQNKPQEIANYKNGKLHGERLSFDAVSGKTNHISHYHEGQAEGLFIDYYPDGLSMQVENYINGQSIGLSRGYYPNGQLMYESSGEADRYRAFDQNGKYLGIINAKPYYDPIEKKLVFQ
ncbi:MAG: hypothetical protein AAGB30_04960 [Pedobacter sp.]